MTLTIDLKDKKGLIVGIANEKSIAWGCAQAFRQAGAELAITRTWGKLDFLLHSIAFAPKEDLQGRGTDSSTEGFLKPWIFPATPSCALQNSLNR